MCVHFVLIIESLTDVTDKDQGIVNNVYADAIRDIKRTNKIKDEITKPLKAVELDKNPKNPKMVPGAKKLDLDKALSIK